MNSSTPEKAPKLDEHIGYGKFKKHQKLISDATPSGEPAIFDGYEIHDQLLTWAINNIIYLPKN